VKTPFLDLKNTSESRRRLAELFQKRSANLRQHSQVIGTSWESLKGSLSKVILWIGWFFQRIFRLGHWWVLIFVSAVRRFTEHDGVTRAAAISYFGLISFFPLVLVLITIVTYFLEAPLAQQQVLELIEANAPTAVDLVQGNMAQILRYRNTVGLVAVVGFFWSASAVFSTMDRALNRVWDVESLRPYWRSKLIAILVVIIIAFLVMFSMVTTTVISFIRYVILPFLASQWGVNLGPWRILMILIPYISSVILFMIVYWIFPHTRVTVLDVWPGALLAGLVWEQAKSLFTVYLGTFGSHNLVYGSVGTIVVLMVWFYLSALILLMGAEVSAAYSRAKRHLLA
jgi:membrane protein